MKTGLRNSIFPLLIALSILSGCKEAGKQADQEDVTENTNTSAPIKAPEPPPVSGTLRNDTLFIGGKFVIFFGPVESPDSTTTLSREKIDAFKSGSAVLIDSLSKYPDIKAVYTTASYFKIYLPAGMDMVVSKAGFKQEVGVVAGDGHQPPTMKKGILTTEEYYKFLKGYFFMK